MNHEKLNKLDRLRSATYPKGREVDWYKLARERKAAKEGANK